MTCVSSSLGLDVSLGPAPWEILLAPASPSMIFFHRRGRYHYWSEIWWPHHLLNPKYHHQNYIWYLMSCLHHLVNSIPRLTCPLICCLLWYLFLPTQTRWRHVAHFPWVPHWLCDLMVVSTTRNWVVTVLGILAYIQVAYLNTPFNWSPCRQQVTIPYLLLIKWCVE